MRHLHAIRRCAALLAAATLALGCAGDCPERAVLTAPDPSRPICVAPADPAD